MNHSSNNMIHLIQNKINKKLMIFMKGSNSNYLFMIFLTLTIYNSILLSKTNLMNQKDFSN